MIEVELIGVSVEVASNTPIVVLQEMSGAARSLSIFIGGPEATAIAFALEGVQAPRPLTHDLFKDVLEAVSIDIDHVIVSELRDATFYAELHLTNGSETWVVSSRPSDALALAARVDCPIYVNDAVMNEAGVADTSDEDEQRDEGTPEEVVEEFRQFIDSVNPEDFAS
ncbi:MAG: bifunctional nuclease family protein [Acidimicrobiales bacterium]